jgi:hypothetical protein
VLCSSRAGTISTAYGTALMEYPTAAFNMRKLARPTATPTVLQAASTPVPSTPTPSTPAAPPETASAPPPFPPLHLTPLNDTFVPKQIALGNPGTRIKIGRQTNAKTIPNATNGYFDSKVLSRMHAEVWSADSKVGSDSGRWERRILMSAAVNHRCSSRTSRVRTGRSSTGSDCHRRQQRATSLSCTPTT